MSNFPSLKPSPVTSSDLPTPPIVNDAILLVEPSAGTDTSRAIAATGEAFLRRVTNAVLSPRNVQRREKCIIKPPLVQRSTSPNVSMLSPDFANCIAVEDHPRGYPRLAALMDSNDFFKIYRKFDFPRGRLLLDR